MKSEQLTKLDTFHIPLVYTDTVVHHTLILFRCSSDCSLFTQWDL